MHTVPMHHGAHARKVPAASGEKKIRVVRAHFIAFRGGETQTDGSRRGLASPGHGALAARARAPPRQCAGASGGVRTV
ncbi:hypothetical protein TRAPUB_2303 [Trametes pubescens]|uniref:Uncharacterized protein n=1 Tax=Trametes pubescens TaxID=154538 RepID=A0A1M2VGV6_TRAPU|nr:hypothetical protein TRAPUB_2303 [Trametes pubescens]